ncbi:MAG: NfeD family protein, partial [Promethearchaeota archaeon]
IISVFCIILALVGIGIIGIPVAGLLLMALGGVLIVVEAKTDVGFAGAAGIGGIICFVLGAIFFLPPGQWLIPAQAMWVFWGISVGFALMFAILFSFAIMKAAEARRLKSELEAERVVGKPGVAETNLDPEGRVRALGESWSAIAEEPPIKAGESVVVVRLEGIRLVVRLAQEVDN